MKPTRKEKRKEFVIAWTVLRIFAACLLWVNVLSAFAVNLLLDAVDGDVFQRFGVKRAAYQKYDKLLDSWWYVMIFVYLVLEVQRDNWWWILVGLFVYRMVGMVLFVLMNEEWLLSVFANYFTLVTFLVLVTPQVWGWDFLLPSPYPAVTVVIVTTLWREWLLHIAKWDLSNFLFGGRKWL